VKNSNFKADRPTYFLVHGFTGNGNSRSNIAKKVALLETDDCNVIFVDWHVAASALYVTAVSYVPLVGESIGNFMDWLVNNGYADYDKIHLLGYSLGAHVVGNAGRATGGKPTRVTGGSLFSAFVSYTPSNRFISLNITVCSCSKNVFINIHTTHALSPKG
jgi:predicted alpha/beta-fold hydrolase